MLRRIEDDRERVMNNLLLIISMRLLCSNIYTLLCNGYYVFAILKSKRHREDMWVRIGTDQVEKEFEEMWETCSNLDDKDYFVMITENMRYMPNYPWADELVEIKAWEEKQKVCS